MHFNNQKNILKKKFDIIMDLDTTSPLRNIRDITKSLAIFKASKYKNLVSISSSKKILIST